VKINQYFGPTHAENTKISGFSERIKKANVAIRPDAECTSQSQATANLDAHKEWARAKE